MKEKSVPKISVTEFWSMTAAEIEENILAAEKLEAKRRDELYRANEILAYNLAALMLTAFNAPRKFPKSPEEAFFRREKRSWSEEKSDFSEIARQLNLRMETKG